jgi:hypothetical protein
MSSSIANFHSIVQQKMVNEFKQLFILAEKMNWQRLLFKGNQPTFFEVG